MPENGSLSKWCLRKDMFTDLKLFFPLVVRYGPFVLQSCENWVDKFTISNSASVTTLACKRWATRWVWNMNIDLLYNICIWVRDWPGQIALFLIRFKFKFFCWIPVSLRFYKYFWGEHEIKSSQGSWVSSSTQRISNTNFT